METGFEAVAAVLTMVLISAVILLFPLSRRLGKVLEEWVKLRHESAPDRDRMDRLEGSLREMRHLVEGIDQRIGLLAERQDFMESLIESKKPDALTSDAESSPYGG
jgi:hypothetical protein